MAKVECWIKVWKFHKQTSLFLIIPKRTIGQNQANIAFVFWKNLKQDNLVLKFSDL